MKKQKKPYNGPMKLVRIDHKTEIEVPANIPDETAKQRFLDRQENWAKSPKDRKRGMKTQNDKIQLDKEQFDNELGA